MHAGPGYLRTSESHLGGTDVFSGLGVTLDAAIGLHVAGHLVLYVESLMSVVRNAGWPDKGGPLEAVEGPVSGGQDLFMLGFGPGAAYQLPLNLYVSATMIFSKLWFLDANTDFAPPDTAWGVGGSVAVGEEWHVTDAWALGLAARFDDAVMTQHLWVNYTKEGEAISPSLNVMTFALLLSATY